MPGVGAEFVEVRIEAELDEFFLPAPQTGFEGEGRMEFDAFHRVVAFDVEIVAEVVRRAVGERSVEEWTIDVKAPGGRGTLLLTGNDGFPRGPGEQAFRLPGGTYEAAYFGLARLGPAT